MADPMNGSNFNNLHAQNGQPRTHPFHFDIHTYKQHGVGIALILLTSLILNRLWQYKKSYLNLPCAGVPPGLLGPWKAAFRYFTHSHEYLREGYQKYAPQGQPFLIATLPRYVVLLTDPADLEELRKAKEEELNIHAAIEIVHKTRITMGEEIYKYHDPVEQIDAIREVLTQRLDYILPDIHDEISSAWEELTSIGSDWARVKAYDVLRPALARVLVGAPLCHNQEYINIAAQFTKDFFIAGVAANNLPWFLRPAAVWYIFKRKRLIERVAKIISPIVDERRRMEGEFGKERWQMEKPFDCIQYVLDQATNEAQKTPSRIAFKLLGINLAALHTTSMSTINTLYDLAAYTEYQQPLRDEIISTLDSFGRYTKQSLTAMKKFDSVLRESARYNGMIALAPLRIALCDFTFKSGKVPFTIPKGTIIGSPAVAIHHSKEIYGPDALEWKGFRFSDIRSKDEATGDKYQTVSLSPNFVFFGLGKNACPGRFFAVAMMKMVLSYMLLKYDFRLAPEWGEKRPQGRYFFGGMTVNTNVELEFRKRDDWDSTMKAKMANWMKVNVE